MRQNIRGLYAVTVDASPNLLLEVEQALEGGACVIQYRDKSNDEEKRFNDALSVKALSQNYSACFLVNDDIELALQVDADGVHIGKDDGNVAQIRNRLGGKILGVSCYNSLERAFSAEQQGADYVAFGRFFNSNTKPDAIAADVELLRKAKQNLSVPIVAIGGITLGNASILINEGVDAIAVVDGLFRRSDIKRAAKEFTNLFQN